MKKMVILMVFVLAGLVAAQNSVTATCTQVSSYPSEQNDNAGGKQTSRIGNGTLYSMLIRVDLGGLVPTEKCTLYLNQAVANVGQQTFDFADGEFNTRVSTVAGTWSSGGAAETPEEGSVCYRYRAYSAASPVLWREGYPNSTVEFASCGQGGSHSNSTGVTLNTVASGRQSYAVLDLALLQDLASGACGGFRIIKAPGETDIEMRFNLTGVVLNWDPNANPIAVERNVKLVQKAAFSSPDPFGYATTILYAGNDATVSIYDVSGVRIRTLFGKNGCAVWNGRDSFGQDAASGTYVYRLELGNKQIVRTMNLSR